MSTDTSTQTSKFTLLSYRPNGERYEGCGEYVRYDSDLDLSTDLSEEELREKLIEKITHGDSCCDSCPASDNENEAEFAILKDGKPIFAVGNNLYSFSPPEETEDTLLASRIWDDAHAEIAKRKQDAAEAAAKAREEAAKKAAEAKRAADEAAARAKEEAERKQLEALKAKYEPATVVVEKAKEQANKLVAEAVG